MGIVYSLLRFTKYEVRYCTYKYFVSLLDFNKHTHTPNNIYIRTYIYMYIYNKFLTPFIIPIVEH